MRHLVWSEPSIPTTLLSIGISIVCWHVLLFWPLSSQRDGFWMDFSPKIKCDHRNQNLPACFSPGRATVRFLTYLNGVALKKEHEQMAQTGWMTWLCVVCVDRSKYKCYQLRKASITHARSSDDNRRCLEATPWQSPNARLDSSSGHWEHNHLGTCYHVDAAQLSLRRELRFCISKKSPSDTHAATPPFEHKTVDCS